MGLAASQARLLTLTSRIHDVELKQQNIANAKMRLANETEEVSNAYTKALNTQRFKMTLTNKSGTEDVKLTINTLLREDSPYRLETKDGKRVTTSDKDKYFTAVCEDMINVMNGCNASFGTKDRRKYHTDATYKEGYDWWQWVKEDDSRLVENQACSYAIMNQTNGEFNCYKDWGKKYGIDNGLTPSLDQIIEAAKKKGVTISREDHQKYIDEFKQMVNESSSGHVSDGTFRIDKQSVSYDKELMKDPNWLYNMIESGELKIVSAATGQDVSTSSATDISTEYDKDVATKAEAEYNAATAKINKKEKMLDMDAKKLDTEYSAMTTEYDSLKEIISKNTERTFQLFS